MITPPAGSQSQAPASLTPDSASAITSVAVPPSLRSRAEESGSLLVVRPRGGGMPDFKGLTAEYCGKCLHTLDLGGADLRGGAWHFLKNFLEELAALDTLDLSSIMIGGRSTAEIGNFGFFLQRVNAMPVRLLLQKNMIGSECIAPIANRLSVDKQLTTLDLAENRLGPADIKTLSDALFHNKTLQCLNLAKNRLDASAIAALHDLLDRAGSLINLDLSGNLFTAEDKAKLQQKAKARIAGPVELQL